MNTGIDDTRPFIYGYTDPDIETIVLKHELTGYPMLQIPYINRTGSRVSSSSIF